MLIFAQVIKLCVQAQALYLPILNIKSCWHNCWICHSIVVRIRYGPEQKYNLPERLEPQYGLRQKHSTVNVHFRQAVVSARNVWRNTTDPSISQHPNNKFRRLLCAFIWGTQVIFPSRQCQGGSDIWSRKAYSEGQDEDIPHLTHTNFQARELRAHPTIP